MNEHTGPYVDSKSRHRESQESKELKKNNRQSEKKMNEQKTKKKIKNLFWKWSFAQILAFIIL